MASVLIIDDNRSKSAFLKIALMRHGHAVYRSQDIGNAFPPRNGRIPDLVLINHATNNSTGWELFNALKQVAPDLPAMVYVLEYNCFYSTDAICKAVHAVCEETHAAPYSHASPLAHLRPKAMHPMANGRYRAQW